MCINCNLVAPIRHQICDLLGIPRNVYGGFSSAFGVLEQLIIDMSRYKRNGGGYDTTKDLPEVKLYNYLVENDLIHYIEEMLDKGGEHSSVVESSFINFALVKYFVTDAPQSGWVSDPGVVDNFRVPCELITSDVERLRRCIGKTRYQQIQLIPQDVIKKWKLKKDKAIEYDLNILHEQVFMEDEKEKTYNKKWSLWDLFRLDKIFKLYV